jgi:hypothetical protein
MAGIRAISASASRASAVFARAAASSASRAVTDEIDTRQASHARGRMA